jgi:hypothetical protein
LPGFYKDTMIVRIFKGVWFFSLLAVFAVLMYIYASLPENIGIFSDLKDAEVSRNVVFYAALAFLAVINASVFMVSRLLAGSSEYFRAWFYGLITFIHLFIIVLLQFLNLYNSQEKFNYDRIGIIIYGSIGMVVLWASLWPVYYLLQRMQSKEVAMKH